MLECDFAFDSADFYPGVLDAFSDAQGIWAVPSGVDPLVMYYNKDLFDQANVSYPTVGWTREDFLETADALRKALPEREIAFGGQIDEAIPFIYAYGGRIRDEQGDYTLMEPLTIEAVQWYTDLALVHEVMPLPAEYDAYQPEEQAGRVISSITTGDGDVPEALMRWLSLRETAFMAAQEGDVALWVNDFSIRQGVGGWDWDFDWGIVSWPQDQHETIVGYPLAYFVAASTPHPEAALRWVNFVSRQPPQLKGLPARPTVVESSRQSFVDELGADTYEALLRVLVEGTPIDYYLYYVSENYLGQAMLDILENGVDVDAALSDAQAELEAEQ
jgi:ABC-type glycerol-3-phosphate transport system substrate-binding protein